MKATATIKVYAKGVSSKVVNKETKERVQSISTRFIDTLTYTVTGKNFAENLNKITTFATRAMGARYKAVIAAGKKLPSKLYFEITLDGKVFRSETALLKANFVNLIAVSPKALAALPVNEIIAKVSTTQLNGLRISAAYLKDVETIASDLETETLPETDLSGMAVGETGELASA